MTFILRALGAIIGIAFLIALAGLFVSGVPSGEDVRRELAAADPGAWVEDQTNAAFRQIDDEGSTFWRGMIRIVFPEETADLPPMVPPAREVAAPPPSDLPPVDAIAIEAAWRDFMARNNLENGAMAILSPDGTLVGAAQGRPAAAPSPVASLSKAITGICLDQVLQEHDLSWYTRLGDIADQMSAVRVTPQPWNDRITLASLVTHTSGLSPDLTQGDMGSDLHGALGLHRRIASEALREDAIQGRAREFFYSNTNYAVLGVVIEALTGQSYAEACLSRVIHPAGIADAVIEGRMGSMSSYAGWEMSAESYARFAQFWLRTGREAIDRPFDRPMHDGYALGYRIADDGPAAQITHTGRYCRRGTDRNFGAFFHARGDGTVFVANWDGCVPEHGTQGLQDAIAPLMR